MPCFVCGREGTGWYVYLRRVKRWLCDAHKDQAAEAFYPVCIDA